MVSRHGRAVHTVSRRVMRGFDRELLRKKREDASLSAPELARLADVGLATLHRWERGASSPQVDLLARVVEVLKCRMTDVVVVDLSNTYPGDLRVAKGLLQPTLGLHAGVSTSTVAMVERGQVGLTDATATKLADALDIPVDMYRAAYERVRSRPRGAAI